MTKKKHWKEDLVSIVKSQINTLYQDVRCCCFLRFGGRGLTFLAVVFPPLHLSAAAVPLRGKGRLSLVMSGADTHWFAVQQVQGRAPCLGGCSGTAAAGKSHARTWPLAASKPVCLGAAWGGPSWGVHLGSTRYRQLPAACVDPALEGACVPVVGWAEPAACPQAAAGVCGKGMIITRVDSECVCVCKMCVYTHIHQQPFLYIIICQFYGI